MSLSSVGISMFIIRSFWKCCALCQAPHTLSLTTWGPYETGNWKSLFVGGLFGRSEVDREKGAVCTYGWVVKGSHFLSTKGVKGDWNTGREGRRRLTQHTEDRGGFRGKLLWDSAPLFKVTASLSTQPCIIITYHVCEIWPTVFFFLIWCLFTWRLESKICHIWKWALPSLLSARFGKEIFKSESFMGPFRTHLAPQRLIQHLSCSLDDSLGCVCLVVMI